MIKRPRRWRPTFRVPDEAEVIHDCQSLGPALLDWLEHQVVLKSFHPLETKRNEDVFWTEGWRALADQLVTWGLVRQPEPPTKVKRSAKR